ncbi:hypothetical protein A4G18_07860 [Pasteurellaceae bacterium Pebbles2]|nr:hypothetical protein [Pasteurellaceae bacterium Pebbles2]
MAYTSLEEQEINEIKSWWKENYKSLIVAVILGAGGVFGWRFWQDHQATKAQEMSAQYDQIIYAASNDTAAKNAQIDQFVQANGKTAYTVLALLDKAKSAVEKQDFSSAETALKDAVAQAPDDILASIAAIRLAEIQLQQKQFDQALSTINGIKDTSWNARKALLTGEVQLAKGDTAAAKQNFEQVLKEGSALEQQAAQVRLNNL